MLRGVGLCVLVFVVSAVPAAAGPWARDPGAVFLSYSLNANSSQSALAAGDFDPRNYHSVYAEIGLGRRLTFGIDAGGDGDSRLAVGFLRYTLSEPADAVQFAVDIGLGQREVGGAEPDPLYRLGFSVGHGFGREATGWVPLMRPDGGWLVLDTTLLVSAETEETIWQTEATLGVNFSERFAGILQVKAEEWPGDDLAVFVSPSLLVRFDTGTSLQLGARFGVHGTDEVGLRLGLWQEF